jgi:F420-0:gamma-glutamyl ligase
MDELALSVTLMGAFGVAIGLAGIHMLRRSRNRVAELDRRIAELANHRR